jgi:light-independent protochlorophyllide reductase subunit N
MLPDGVVLSEGQDVERSSTAAAPRGPTSSSAVSGSPTRSKPRALTTKWSIELVFTPIHGYEQAGDLAELFARPLVRRKRLRV